MKCPESRAWSTSFRESRLLPSSGSDELGTLMSRIFISPPATGLGLMAAELRVQRGHQGVLHARSAGRAEDALLALPQAEAVVEGDLDTIAGASAVAKRAN